MVTVTAEEEGLVLRAASAVGADAAGVDLLPGPNGEWNVLEVNAVPGWRALAPVTGGRCCRGDRPLHCELNPSTNTQVGTVIWFHPSPLPR